MAESVVRGLAFPDPDDAEFIVEDGVRKLGGGHKKTLRYHLAVGTQALGGPDAWDLARGGAGAVQVLAVAREVPPKDLDIMASDDEVPGAADALRQMGGARFLGAVYVLDPAKVLECVRRGLM